jgi:type II secretory pathway predicted ATPase ExeA
MYNEHFGFLESPFSLTPDPDFFFATPAYLEAYATLRYGIESKKGFVAVTGEVGTGKTTLLRKLMRELESTIHFALVFNTDLSYNELLRVVLRDFGIRGQTSDRAGMVDEINAYLLEQLQNRHIVCVLIDEAQDLSDESLEGLRLLSNLETDKEKLLQIVLMGQPEFKGKLDKPGLRQLKQRIAVRCELPPLNRHEVGPYIEFRLKAAGYNRRTLFPPAAVQEIADYARGIPRLINIICDNALLITFAASRTVVAPGTIAEAAADLGLQPRQPEAPKQMLAAEPARTATEAPVHHVTNRSILRWPERKLKTGVGAFSVILFSLAVVFISDLVFTGASKRFEVVRHNSQQWMTLVNRPEINSDTPALGSRELPSGNSAVEKKPSGHRATVRYGSTIYGIATDAYGVNAALGMDLIKQLNPQIENLNWVAAGQEILLPALSRETLLRRQSDGSYRLTVGSFFSRKDAEQLADRIIRSGYQILITPRQLTNNLALYRLEIDSLRNASEAMQSFETALTRQWLILPAGASEDRAAENSSY